MRALLRRVAPRCHVLAERGADGEAAPGAPMSSPPGGTVVDLNLRVTPRDPDACIRVALRVAVVDAMGVGGHALRVWRGVRRSNYPSPIPRCHHCPSAVSYLPTLVECRLCARSTGAMVRFNRRHRTEPADEVTLPQQKG